MQFILAGFKLAENLKSMKKLLLLALITVSSMKLFAQTTPPTGEPTTDPDARFIGWSFTEVSATMEEGGTGNCYQECTAKYYLFFVKVTEQTMWRYADCQTGEPISKWVPSLLGLPYAEPYDPNNPNQDEPIAEGITLFY